MLFQSAEGEQNSCAAVILVYSPVSNKGFESHPAGIQMTSKKSKGRQRMIDIKSKTANITF